MSDTNFRIAELLLKQTYQERMEMAEWFSSVLNDHKADMKLDEGFDASGFAMTIQGWADNEMEESE